VGTCLKCINSACCRLTIDVSKEEYNLLSNDMKQNFTKYSDDFISNSPKYESKRSEIDGMYNELYAYIPKSQDRLCKLLNRKTMLCSVYNDRPKVCRDYELKRCEKIRLCTY
jgi:Fe-S-cluster containining protein